MEDVEPPISSATATVVLRINGMSCGSCSALVEETLLEDLGVVSANVNLATGLATVTFDETEHSIDDLCAAVMAVGYSATLDITGRA